MLAPEVDLIDKARFSSRLTSLQSNIRALLQSNAFLDLQFDTLGQTLGLLQQTSLVYHQTCAVCAFGKSSDYAPESMSAYKHISLCCSMIFGQCACRCLRATGANRAADSGTGIGVEN